MIKLDLENLRAIIPDLTYSWSMERLEATIFCLDKNAHPSGTTMELSMQEENCILEWQLQVDQKIKNTWNDLQKATEKGAEGIAAILVDKLTPYKIIRRSAKTTGIDYWLGEKDQEVLFFQSSARLEVSGLLNGTDSEYRTRLRLKRKQTKRSDNTGLPVYVSITDFGKPRTMFLKL